MATGIFGRVGRGQRPLPAGSLAGSIVALALVAGACSAPPSSEMEAAAMDETQPASGSAAERALDPPAAAGAFAPRLVTGDDDLLMTWWEPLEIEAGSTGHRLMFSRHSEAWSEPTVVVEGRDFFANWADFPNLIREPGGSLLVTWLEKTAEETFAYSIFLARSRDEGSTWEMLGRLNDDATHTEHGFVSLIEEGSGVRAFWLDGREMADGGPMTVRSAYIGETPAPSELIDDRVCECCPTDAVATADGSTVVYRDRTEDETRDIFTVSRRDGAWLDPAPATHDGWRVPGCPVNGPAIAHLDGVTTLAWFTAADDSPRVSLTRGLSDGTPIVIDADRPLGRVGLVMDRDGSAVVSWLAVVDDEAELRLRRVDSRGVLGASYPVARTSGGRGSGVPQLARRDESLFVAWLEVVPDRESRIRMREIPTALVPAG